MAKLNDPIAKRKEFLKGIGVKMVTDKVAFQWYPVTNSGEYKLPSDWEVPTNYTPSPKAVAKYVRNGRVKIMLTLLEEVRFLQWKYKNGGLDTLKEHERFTKIKKQLGIMSPSRRHWPKGWKTLLTTTLEKGLSIPASCRKVGLSYSTIMLWYKNYPDFAMIIDNAIEGHKIKLIEALDDIAFKGKSETNKLNAIKFSLERRYKDEYGAKSLFEADEVQSPLDIFFGTTNGEDEEDEE